MFTKTAIVLAAANLAAAHTTFQSFVIDGQDQGQHFAVQTPSNGNNPILDVTSTAMICNGGTATSDQVEVAAGSTIGMQWHHNDPATDNDGDEPIAASHKGPVMVYIAKADTNGEGAVWQKIFEDGLTGSQWGVDNFIANKGLISVDLPDLEAGDYLIRPEMIGLHEASAEGKAQFYNGCGQIKVTGSGSASLPAEGVDMTKAYKATDPGVMFNIYSGATDYTIPGPAVWDAASSSSPATPATPTEEAESSTPSATEPASTPSASPVASSTPSTGSDSDLPETFTMEQFIQWLRTATGSASSKARRHARAFHF